MNVSLEGFSLDSAGAQKLRSLLSGQRSSVCAAALIDHVLGLGAKYAIIEDPYIDKDYSADYLNFYAAAFKEHARHTRRVHLFADPQAGGLMSRPLHEQQAALQAAGYLGFVVLRPIRLGPIGRTVLKFPDLGPALIVRPAARADFKAHLLGSALKIEGAAPFIQQDERLGSCAQASIWMAARPVHERHRRTSWHSVAEITTFATTPTDAELSRSLPAGSGGLDPIHIIRALRGMGHQPLFDYFLPESRLCPENGKDDEEAQLLRPVPGRGAATITRYLDSGLPVVVALADLGQAVGHAITAVGFVEDRGATCREAVGYDAFVRALLVHDDQRGPYRLMPITQDDVAHLPADRLLVDGDKVLTVEEMATHMFVPLSPRVFLRADAADTVVRDYLKYYVEIAGPGMLDKVAALAPDGVATVEAFYELVRAGRLILRTYLTSAARYRHHLAHTDLAEEIKREFIAWRLPHFVWVTEFLTPDAAAPEDGGARQVIGHAVVNATSSTDVSSDILLVHMPHVLVLRNINPKEGKPPGPDDETAGPPVEADPDEPWQAGFAIQDGRPYRGRRRT